MKTLPAELLFKIENNTGFEWEALSPADTKTPELLSRVARLYGLDFCGEAVELRKRNKASRIFRIACESGRFVLKAMPLHFASLMEEQCFLASQLQTPYLIRPLHSDRGTFTSIQAGWVWTAYPYLELAVFEGSSEDIVAVILKCLSVVQEMRGLDSAVQKVFCVRHHRRGWETTLPQWIRQDRFDAPPFPGLLSKDTQALLRERLSEIERITRQVARVDPAAELSLCHYDMNHANVLILGGNPLVLDLEAICVENPNIAAAHCIFKLLRHCIYTGAKSLKQVRESFLPQLLDQMEGFPALKSPEGFCLYSHVRIVSDLQRILDRILVQKDSVLPTDLEKKIMNLFETCELTRDL